MKQNIPLIAGFLLVTLAAGPAVRAAAQPVRVYILAGQSNMEGHGFIAADPRRNDGKGSLEFIVKHPSTAKRFGHLVDAGGHWRTRDDVWISYLDRKGPLTVGYGASPDLMGPELGLGWVLGDALDEPVLLIKCAWGGKSLAVDFRPPSAGKPPYSLGEKGDAAVAKNPEIIGTYYRETLSLTKTALANIKELVPGSDGSYVLSGFGWHQGWNDRINDKFNAEYESNLAHFIRDIRKDLGEPALPFVIGETGMGGPDETHPRALSLMKAQAAVAERPEFRGNVTFVSTRAFWRPKEQSPNGQGYHWNSNAETYYLIGEAMGKALLAAADPSRARAGRHDTETQAPQRVNAGDEAAGDSPPPLSTTLTLDRLFSTREFETEVVPQIRWSKRSSTYFTLAPAPSGQGRDLLRTDPATGQHEVVVAAAAFVPEKGAAPLAVDAFEFSHDESKLLIYNNSKKVWRRNTRGDYWVLDLASLAVRKLGGDAGPSTLMFARFAPDGSRVAYVRQGNLYVQELQGMQITALTTDGSATLINGTSDWVNEEELNLRDCFRWSPDGQQLVFWQFDTSGVPEFHLLNNTESNDPRIISFAYPKVGEKNSATRLGVVGVRGGEVRWLQVPGDSREHYIPHAEWTPDGSQLLIQQFNRLQTENRVMVADPRTGVTRPLMTETDPAWLENENPVRWLSAGKSILWISERSGWRHAYQASLDGDQLTPITQGEFDVIDVEAVDAAGGWLYFAASPENATQRYLFRAPLEGRAGPTERLSPPAQPGWHEYDVSPDAKWAVHRYSTFTTPPVVELVRLPDHSVVRVLADNRKLRERLDALNRPSARFLSVAIGSGITLDAWCLEPPGMDRARKYPLLIHVYGEPHSPTVKDVWPGPRGLWHWMLAQQGCVVASVDNRGTNVPRGRAWRKSVHRKIGILAAQEQARAVRALLERWSFIDPARVGVWGWSGGGSMSLNAIFRYPFLYRTAVAVAPNADQRLYDTIYQERYMGLPADNAEGYRDGSPLTYAYQFRGNLLLIHGTGDDNCHYQGTERLINELIAWNKRFSVLSYPNRSHSISEGPNTVRHFWGYLARYLSDNLISADAPAPELIAETRRIRGWSLHINRALLATERALTERAVKLLDRQLEAITRVVPEKSLAALREVPLYFSPEYPGVRPRAEYHPNAQWLFEHGRDPAMAKGVEFTNIRIFERESNRMPNFALHELAHAYHDRLLAQGFGNADIRAAYAEAKKSGTYDHVERHHGNGKPNTFERAYALTSPMEYFAESSEAFFSRNDFFPFTRDELKRHDQAVFDLLEKLWNQPGP